MYLSWPQLPDSLCRRGRFDRQIEFNSPNMADAEKIVNYYLKGKKVDPSVNLEDLTKMLDCGSCTMLETVLNEAGKINYHVFKPVLFEFPMYEYFVTGEKAGNCGRMN